MIKMKLVDGTELEFSGLNGTNLVVPDQQEMDTSVFTDDNLKEVTFTDDDGKTYEYQNLSFIQQQKQLNEDYYICFYEKSEQDLFNEDVKELMSKTEDIEKTLVRIAEIQINLGNMTADDLEGSIRDTVKADIEGGLEKDFP